MANVVAVCTSREKGTKKDPVEKGLFQKEYGLTGDAHADSGTHRQVSLLAVESIGKMRELGYAVDSGDFGENLTTEGIDVAAIPVGTRIAVGDNVILEITQIGKECHSGCAIFVETGTCIMPKEGVFARVNESGMVKPGDSITVLDVALGM